MGKKSAFEYLDEQEDKVIQSVNIKGGDVTIKWKIPDEASGTLSETEPASNDLLSPFDELKEFALIRLANKLTGDSRKNWMKEVKINEVTFRKNTKGETAQLKGTIPDGNQVSDFKLAATPLYDPDLDGHETGAVPTFGEAMTKALKTIQQEARMYLGGKRGEMQSTIMDQGA